MWGLGKTLVEPEPWVESARGLWRKPSAHHAIRAQIEIDVRLLDPPVQNRDLRAAGVDALEVQRQPFMANPSFVTRDELATLLPLLPPWPQPEQP